MFASNDDAQSYANETNGAFDVLRESIDWHKTHDHSLKDVVALRQGQHLYAAKVFAHDSSEPLALKFVKCDRVGHLLDWQRVAGELAIAQANNADNFFAPNLPQFRFNQTQVHKLFDGVPPLGDEYCVEKICNAIQKPVVNQTLHLMRHTRTLAYIAKQLQHIDESRRQQYEFVQLIVGTLARAKQHVFFCNNKHASNFWKHEQEQLASMSTATLKCQHDALPRLFVLETWLEATNTETMFAPAHRANYDAHFCWTALRNLFAAYSFLHEKCRVVHHDVSFSNVTFRYVGPQDAQGLRVCINDFGFAHCLSHDRVQRSFCTSRCGSPYFSSPQKWRSKQHDDESDECFALGVLAYFILYGEICWPANVKNVRQMTALVCEYLRDGKFKVHWQHLIGIDVPLAFNVAVQTHLATLLMYDESKRASAQTIVDALEAVEWPEACQ